MHPSLNEPTRQVLDIREHVRGESVLSFRPPARQNLFRYVAEKQPKASGDASAAFVSVLSRLIAAICGRQRSGGKSSNNASLSDDTSDLYSLMNVKKVFLGIPPMGEVWLLCLSGLITRPSLLPLLQIDASGSLMGARGLKELALTLNHMRCDRITSVDLSCCDLWPASLATLLPPLTQQPHEQQLQQHVWLASVEHLNLDNNHLGDEGVAVLASAIVRGLLPALSSLSLAHNGVTDLGAIVLANGMFLLCWFLFTFL